MTRNKTSLKVDSKKRLRMIRNECTTNSVIIFVYNFYRLRDKNFFIFRELLIYYKKDVLLCGLIILQRFLAKQTSIKILKTKHFVVCCLIAAKYLLDQQVEVSCMYYESTRLLQIEREVLFSIDYDLYVRDEEINCIENIIEWHSFHNNTDVNYKRYNFYVV